MRISLSFRLYMMRYGIALLASKFTNSNRASFSEDICKKVANFLTEKREVSAENIAHFKEYLFNKPGSPRYTPLRKKIEKGQQIRIENQDLLLSDPTIPSSVGALTKNYFDDALSLAHILKLVKKDQNVLLTRGRLSLSTSWSEDNPFNLNEQDTLYLGFWLLDVDCDWIWAFFKQLSNDPNFEITIENRVELLLKSWEHLLSARQLRTGHPHDAKVRTRIKELVKITERNVREGLNLGQPWSWFLIPRLELLVDAGIFYKKNKHGLTGYGLTSTGLKFQSVSSSNDRGESLIQNYFSCRSDSQQIDAKYIQWDEILENLKALAPLLQTSVGYFPIFETAAALCVSKFLSLKKSNESIWEIDMINETLMKESKSLSPRVRLAIDRQGKIYAFKPEDRL